MRTTAPHTPTLQTISTQAELPGLSLLVACLVGAGFLLMGALAARVPGGVG